MTRRLGSAVGPVNASTCRSTFPGISALQLARSSALSNLIGTYSIPRSSSIRLANSAGQPPSLPVKMRSSATRWRASASSSM
ncbi:Uncharacterised protein [Mycobacteroides abscessus subsp. abscessus]|nr:Uncharacterised protein [Mycobacteroides abscessus subsp. abscessus]